MSAHNYHIGDKVRFIDEEAHEKEPRCYPRVGTIGTVVMYGIGRYLIMWPKRSTSMDDVWWSYPSRIEPVEEAEA